MAALAQQLAPQGKTPGATGTSQADQGSDLPQQAREGDADVDVNHLIINAILRHGHRAWEVLPQLKQHYRSMHGDTPQALPPPPQPPARRQGLAPPGFSLASQGRPSRLTKPATRFAGPAAPLAGATEALAKATAIRSPAISAGAMRGGGVLCSRNALASASAACGTAPAAHTPLAVWGSAGSLKQGTPPDQPPKRAGGRKYPAQAPETPITPEDRVYFQYKRCSWCSVEKSLSDFHAGNDKGDRHKGHCKSCSALYAKDSKADREPARVPSQKQCGAVKSCIAGDCSTCINAQATITYKQKRKRAHGMPADTAIQPGVGAHKGAGQLVGPQHRATTMPAPLQQLNTNACSTLEWGAGPHASDVRRRG